MGVASPCVGLSFIKEESLSQKPLCALPRLPPSKVPQLFWAHPWQREYADLMGLDQSQVIYWARHMLPRHKQVLLAGIAGDGSGWEVSRGHGVVESTWTKRVRGRMAAAWPPGFLTTWLPPARP